MAAGEDTITLPGAGELLGVRSVVTVNGAAVTERQYERVILAMLNPDGTLSDINEDTPAWIQGLLSLLGEDHIGEVGGNTAVLQPSLTVSTTAYAVGDVIGGKITLTNAMRKSNGTGVLHSLTVIDDDNNSPGFHMLLFSQDLTGTYTDNVVPSLNAADNAKFIGHVTVAASDYVSIGTGAGTTQSIATKRGLSLPVAATNDTKNLFALLIATTTPAFATSSDLIIRVGLLRD
jgi:hypothetical protein